MHPLIEGIILGLTIAILLGPAFFALIQTSIHRGFKSGFFLALGIFFSDLSLVVLCYFGVSQILYNNPRNNLILGIIGGMVLIAIGIYTFTRKVSICEKNTMVSNNTPGPITYILKGYFLNLANPSVWFFWMTVVVGVGANYGVNTEEIFVFFSGLFITIFCTDLIKCFVSNGIKRYLTDRLMERINHIVGMLLVIIGLVLMIRPWFPSLMLIFNRYS